MAISAGPNTYDVTVLMPVYNGVDFVETAIQSIQAQENVKCKLIVFNDGSSDSTLEVLSRFSCRNVQVINSNENKGYVHALNQMLPLVTSPYIARIDADDEAKPSRLIKQLTYIESKPSTLVLASDFEYMDSRGRVLDYSTDRCSGLAPNGALLFDNVICHPTVLLRTSIFSNITPEYDSSIMPAEDYDLWLKCSEVGDVEIYPEKLTRYRLHPNQVTGLSAKGTYRKNSIIRRKHVSRVEASCSFTSGGGITERIKRTAAYESFKYSLDAATSRKLYLRYLQDVCIAGDLRTNGEVARFVGNVMIDQYLTSSEKLLLLRFSRKSLFRNKLDVHKQ